MNINSIKSMFHSINKQVILINIKFMFANPKILFFDFFIWLFISLMPLFISLLIQQIFNSLEESNIYIFICYGFIYIIINILHLCAVKFGGIFDAKYRFGIKKLFQESVFMYSLKKKKKSFESTSEFVEIFQNDPGILENLCSAELDLINQIIFTIVGVIILARINVVITIFVLIPYAIGINFLKKFGDTLSRNQSKKRNVEIEYTNFAKDVYENRISIQNFDLSDNIGRKSAELNKKALNVNIRRSVSMIALEKLPDFLGKIVTALILLLGFFYYKKGDMMFGDITLFLTYFSYANVSVAMFSEVYTYIQYCEEMLQRIKKQLNNNLADIVDLSTGFTEYKEIRQPFCCSENQQLKINGTVIQPGEVVKISSRSRSVTMEDVKKLLDLERGIFGIVYQKTNFFNDTIYNNVSLYEKNINCDLYLDIAELSINKLRNWDYESKIGVNGEKLSVGQRQRLAIARALASKSQILLLDDIFKNLDSQNIDLIVSNLIKHKYIVFYISNNFVLDNYKTHDIVLN